MGYVKTGTTLQLNLHLTEAGRRAIVSGTVMSSISKFALSDGDIDYRSSSNHADTVLNTNDSPQLGFIPNVTGDLNSCTTGVNQGYQIKDFIWKEPDGATINVTSQKFVAIGVKGTDGTTKFYKDNLVQEVYIHDYVVFCKLLAAKYIEDHKDILSDAPSTIEGSITDYFKDTLQVPTANSYKNFLDQMTEFGVGQYLDWWQQIKVWDGSTYETTNVKIKPYDEQTYFNNLALCGGGFVSTSGKDVNRGQYMGMNFENTSLRGVNLGSPFSMMFSSGLSNINNRAYPGAGPAGIGFGAFEMGYLNVGGVDTWNNDGESYPKFNMSTNQLGWATEVGGDFSMRNIFIGFVTSVDLEKSIGTGVDNLGNQGYTNINTTIPTARLITNVTNNNNSPEYYPIKLSRLTKKSGDYLKVGGKNNTDLGIKVTHTNHETDTFGLLGGSLRYGSNWTSVSKGLSSGSVQFNIEPSKGGNKFITSNNVKSKTEPYYTLFTSMMSKMDDLFISMASQNNSYWGTDTYSGGFQPGLSGSGQTQYSISIPCTWMVHSSDPSVAPCKVTVRFVYNQRAARIGGLPIMSTAGVNYYRLYDNSTFRFYGANGGTLSAFANDPRGHNSASSTSTPFQTSDNQPIFRQVVSGQEIT